MKLPMMTTRQIVNYYAAKYATWQKLERQYWNRTVNEPWLDHQAQACHSAAVGCRQVIYDLIQARPLVHAMEKKQGRVS